MPRIKRYFDDIPQQLGQSALDAAKGQLALDAALDLGAIAV
jgi:hypothetical protein